MTTHHAENRACFMGQMAGLADVIPDTLTAFMALHRASVAPGALDTRTKELIALGVAIAVHCDTCIDCHVHDARDAGATREEIANTIGVAILMGGGPAVVYGVKALEAFDEYEATP